MKRIKDFFKKFDQSILNKQQQKVTEEPKFDFKGQRIKEKVRGQGPSMTKEQFY